MEQSELLERAIKKLGTLDAVRVALSLEHGNLNNIKAGKRPMPAWIAAALAEIAGLDPEMEALAALERSSKSERERSVWARLIQQTSKGLTMALLAALLSFQPSKSYANSGISNECGLYIMRNHAG